MKHLTIICLAISVMILSPGSASGQQVSKSKIKWTVTSFRDLSDNSETNSAMQFITDIPNRSLQWIQNGGKTTYAMTILKIEEKWRDVLADGSCELSIQWTEQNGRCAIIKKDGQIKIHLQANPSGKDNLNLEFMVSGYEIL